MYETIARITPLGIGALIMKRGLLTIVIFLFSFSLFSVALAKIEPYIENPGSDWGGVASAWQAPSGLTGGGFFGHLSAGDVDAFAFTLDQPMQDWLVTLQVPACGEHFAAAYPSMAIIGPGLDAPAGAALPFDLPEGTGAVVYTMDDDSNPRAASNQEGMIAMQAYQPIRDIVDTPDEGQYIFALWEPDGNPSAYALSLESGHSIDESRSMSERDAAFDLLLSGDWMGVDCNVSAASGGAATAANCDDDSSGGGAQAVSNGSFVVTGTVRDSLTCQPIANARVHFWLTDASGRYDATPGYVDTDAAGAYYILSDRPDDDGHEIHLYIRADGYHTLTDVQAVHMVEATTQLSFDLVPLAN
jgi:hypothetical protein